MNAYLAGVDEDSGRSERSKLARKKGLGLRKTMTLGIASSYHELIQNDFLGEAYPPFDPVRGIFSFNGLLLLVCQIPNQGTRC